MPGRPLTHFKTSPSRLAVVRECMDDYGVATDDAAEWPNNILSRRTVVYGSGAIGRRGESVSHKVDPDELALCKALAKAARKLMKNVDAGLESEAQLDFRDFYIAANVGDPVPRRITEALIRQKFGGTIFPPATVTVEPLAEKAAWWAGVARSAQNIAEEEDEDTDLFGDEGEPAEGGGHSREFLDTWRALVRWFRECPEFKDSAFVKIGDYDALRKLLRDKTAKLPEGTVTFASALPRLFVGLTQDGSLAGLFTYVVLT